MFLSEEKRKKLDPMFYEYHHQGKNLINWQVQNFQPTTSDGTRGKQIEPGTNRRVWGSHGPDYKWKSKT